MSQFLRDECISAGFPLKVICIGAGYSGILTAIRLPQKIPNLDLVIYEKNKDIGGTWFENRYPGIACDIPSHAYQFTFANNPSWSRFYAGGAEIQEYLKDVAWKYDVERYVRLQHRFEGAKWDETQQLWEVSVRDLTSGKIKIDTAHILLKGTGLLNKWDWPKIEGLHSFRGPYMHSADWDQSFDWTDKTVALIGCGSSGIQILPSIQPKAKRVLHFVRGKTWISPVGFSPDEPENVIHTEQETQAFSSDAAFYQEYRKKIEAGLNQSQLVTFRGTEIQRQFWTLCQESMRTKLAKKPWLYDSICPGQEYPPGCRRLTPGPGYLEALVEENVDVLTTGIKRVTETGLIDSHDNFHEVDAVIYATGFDYAFDASSTPIIGRNGTKLQDRWNPYPEAYLSLCVPEFPNFFIFLGPNGGPASGSFIAMLEVVVEYIIKCVQKLQREHLASMEVAEEPLIAFSRHVDEYFEKSIFTYNCRSWFKRNQSAGRVVGLWPGSSVHAQEALQNPRYEDFIYVRRQSTMENMMDWLGNGLTTAQCDSGGSTAYLDNVDIPAVINHSPRIEGTRKQGSLLQNFHPQPCC